MDIVSLAEIHVGIYGTDIKSSLKIIHKQEPTEMLVQDIDTSRKLLMSKGYEYKQALGNSQGMLQTEIWIKTSEL